MLIACIAAFVSPSVCSFIVQRWNREVHHYKLDWLEETATVSRAVVIASTFFGTLSHVVLDSFMHHDIHPFAPFSNANPMLNLISHDGVYQLCFAAGAYFSPSWTAFQADRGRDFSVIVDGISN